MHRIIAFYLSCLLSLVATDDLRAQTTSKALILGQGGRVQVPNSSTLQPPSAITVEGWLYPVENGVVNAVFLGKGDGGNAFSDQSYWLSWSKLQDSPGRTLSFNLFLGASTWATIAAPNVASNRWVHFAATYDSVLSRLQFFTNGVLANTRGVDAGGSPLRSQPIRQSSLPLVFGNQNPFNDPRIAAAGAMDDIRIWSRALTAEEIASEYRCGSLSDATLKGRWNFDNSTAEDSSGNRNDGLLTGAATVATPPLADAIHQACGAAQTATAVAMVLNGFLVGISVIDGGSGYAEAPEVTITGPQGQGAAAVAHVSGGVVTEVVVRSAGSGYGALTVVKIGAPRASFPVETLTVLNLTGVPGATVSLEYADKLELPMVWKRLGDVLLSEKVTSFIEPPITPLGTRFYRVAQAITINPTLASARAQILNGFVVDVVLEEPGLGYVEPPTVSIFGGGGVGALATAMISAGKVTAIKITNAGKGYTSTPTIVLGSPPAAGPLRVAATPLRTLLAPSPLPNPDYLKWVWIPEGQFTMGSPADESGRYADEGPQTQVVFTYGFWMARFLVTQKEYERLMGNNPSWFRGNPDLPVDTVTWEEATEFCVKLNAVESAAGKLPAGYAYRLPTEAEWEYAARSGTTRRFSFGDDLSESTILDYAWFVGNSGGTTHVSGLKRPNPWGVFDMYGNVWQWCLDRYGVYPGGTVVNPSGSTSSDHHVFRGGSWVRIAADCRAARRNQREPGTTNHDQGFRLVLAPTVIR